MLRRHVVAAAGAAVLAGCGVASKREGPASSKADNLPREQQWARTAWRYVENNTDFDTGLCAGMDHASTFTVWNAGDMLAAITCAHELGVIGPREFDMRLSRVLGFLGAMDLSQGLLPNKAYHAATKKMVAFDGREDDIGWSAVDIGRLMVWLEIVARRHPKYAEYADRIVLRWNFCQVIDDCGQLQGATRDKGQVYRYQEGRLGYEQLAGAGFALWGFDAHRSARAPATQVARIDGLPVHYDARDPRTSGAQAPVLTQPYALMGMELGWVGREELRGFAEEVRAVQEQRWRREKLVTARSDYQLREAPYVVLDSVYASGYAWNTVASDARSYEKLALVNARAAFGIWALWPGEYAEAAIESLRFMYDPDRGWFEGRLEAGGAPQATITLATNAAVLEALLYRAKGVLCLPRPRNGYWAAQQKDVFARRNQCLPGERPACKR